ncbi:hypothetical protein ACPF7Z_11095 [Halomonas sp. GXIMD04776]|uniref:hypothetical protein n=1 Tax=Halomonas sp. GXIMD04776 TaxID=3415605 RepID=UPI003C8BB3D2
MGRWLEKIPKSPGQHPYKTYKSPSVGSVGSLPGTFAEKTAVAHAPVEAPAPAATHEIDSIIDALANQVGRDLGPRLERHIRQALAPLSRGARAELAAVIDDAFEVANSVEAARWQCHRLLRNEQALQAAMAVWPDYPTPAEGDLHA